MTLRNFREEIYFDIFLKVYQSIEHPSKLDPLLVHLNDSYVDYAMHIEDSLFERVRNE